MKTSRGTSTHASYTPRPVASDSDLVVLALVTANGLEAQGEIREAARWLRRGADQARKEGNEERVLVLSRAAANLTKSSGSARWPSSSRRATARTSWRRTTLARSSSSATSREKRSDSKGPSQVNTMEAMLALIAGAG
jgi:hypothetical protein